MPDKGTPSLRVGASSGRITTLLFIIFLISWAFPTCVTFVKCTQTAVGLVNDKEHFDNTAAAAPADVHGGDDEDKEDDNQGLNGSAVTNGDGGGDDTAAPAAPPSLGTRSRIQQLVHASAKRGHGRRKKKAWKVRVDASSSSSSSSPEVVGSAATGEAEHHHHHRHPSSVGIAKKHSKLKDVIAAEQQRNKRWQQLLQQQQEQKQGGQTPTICFFDWARNERTAAAFVTNIFGRYRSPFNFAMVASDSFGQDAYAEIAVPRRQCAMVVNLIDFFQANNAARMCRRDSPCIVTGDEFCRYVEGLNPNIIARQYFSTKYKIPSISLGPGITFSVPANATATPPAQRKYLFNFIGSIGKQLAKADRLEFREEIEKFTANGTNEWGARSYTRFTPWMHFTYNARVQDAEQESSAARILDEESSSRHKLPAAGGAISSQREAAPVSRPRYLSLDDAASTYSHVVAQSIFTLDPVGDHDECYRFWEAILAGSIPVFVPRKSGLTSDSFSSRRKKPVLGTEDFACPGAMDNIFQTDPPIVVLDSWSDFPNFITTVTNAQIESLHERLSSWFDEWWQNQTDVLSRILAERLRKKA